MKTMPKSHLQICKDLISLLGPCVTRLLFIAGLAISAALWAPAVSAAEHVRVHRVADTWETSASDDSIYFDPGSSSLDAAASQTVQRHVSKLRVAPELHIVVIAHVNDLGSSSLELAKGQERLDAVRKLLEESKISAGRIRMENHGSENRSSPPCADEECRRRNRRVDFLLHR